MSIKFAILIILKNDVAHTQRFYRVVLMQQQPLQYRLRPLISVVVTSSRHHTLADNNNTIAHFALHFDQSG